MLAMELRDVFGTYADALEILGDNPYRVRSYRRVAQTVVEVSDDDLHTLTARELEELPGIGEAIAAKIVEYRETGKIAEFEEHYREVPPGLFELLSIPHIGPRSVHKLWKELGVKDMAGLRQVLEDGRLEGLKGFGPKSVENIRHSLDLVKKSEDRIPLAEAEPIGTSLEQYMQRCPQAEQVAVAGSLRRKKDTIGDVDVLVSSTSPQKVIDHFLAYPHIVETIARGSTKASVRISTAGRQVDLRVIPPESFGSALQYFTGNKAHNVQLRQIAQRQEMKLSEYGLFTGSIKIAGETEQGIYDALGVPMPPPEKRLGKDELG